MAGPLRPVHFYIRGHGSLGSPRKAVVISRLERTGSRLATRVVDGCPPCQMPAYQEYLLSRQNSFRLSVTVRRVIYFTLL